MERKVRAYKQFFVKFIEGLKESESKKVFYVIDILKTQERISQKFVKYLEEGIFELRAESEGNIFRVLFIFDEGNIILLLNGFHKKTQKTPRHEIEIAKRLKKEYYNEKGK